MYTIRYFAADRTMGTTPHEACEAFRRWAQARLEALYPGYTIEVSDQPSVQQCWTDDDEHPEEISEMCACLWQTCPREVKLSWEKGERPKVHV